MGSRLCGRTVRKNPQTLTNAWLTKRYHYVFDSIEVDAPL